MKNISLQQIRNWFYNKSETEKIIYYIHYFVDDTYTVQEIEEMTKEDIYSLIGIDEFSELIEIWENEDNHEKLLSFLDSNNINIKNCWNDKTISLIKYIDTNELENYSLLSEYELSSILHIDWEKQGRFMDKTSFLNKLKG